MKTLFLVIALNTLAATIFAQCNSTEEVNNMPTVYSKGYSESYMPTAEQEKYLTGIFISVIEPALKSTKGLKGDWEPMGVLKGTPLVSQNGLSRSDIQMYMNLMGCKDHKIYEKHETGLIIEFYLNSLHGVSIRCEHTENQIVKNKNVEVTVADMLDGRQIYCLYKPTVSDKYANVAYFRKTGDAHYFIIAKPGVPLFVPLTVRQALEINNKNSLQKIDAFKQQLLSPDLQPATRADYEKSMAKDFATYRSSYTDPEKFISDLITELENLKKGGIKGIQFFIDFYTKSVNVVTEYLKTIPATELEKPLISGTEFLNRPYISLDDEQSGLNSRLQDANSQSEYVTYVMLNPAYLNTTISKAAPQFLTVEIRIQGGSAVALKAFNDFEANLDLKKLQDMLVK